jgi:hypothetical protein
MGHLQVWRAAVIGKRRVNKPNRSAQTFAGARRLIVAAVTLLAATIPGSVSYAQSGPFAGMGGNWSGAGTVTLEDGSTERIRCRATYVVDDRGTDLKLTLICASDSYKFDLSGNVFIDRGALSGNWSEASRNVHGSLDGSGAGGKFQVLATAAGFAAQLSVTTRGNRQSVEIRSQQSNFRGASMSLSRR